MPSEQIVRHPSRTLASFIGFPLHWRENFRRLCKVKAFCWRGFRFLGFTRKWSNGTQAFLLFFSFYFLSYIFFCLNELLLTASITTSGQTQLISDQLQWSCISLKEPRELLPSGLLATYSLQWFLFLFSLIKLFVLSVIKKCVYNPRYFLKIKPCIFELSPRQETTEDVLGPVRSVVCVLAP